MWMKRWHRWFAGRKRTAARRTPRGTFRPQLERLEQVIAPTLQLGTLALTPGGPITEGSTATLSGSYIATNTIGRVSLVANWGDGSTPSTVNLAPGNGSFSVPHRFVDNNPTDNNTPTTIPVHVTAQLLDAGPTIISATPNGTNKDGGGYQAVDYPFIRNVSLATAPVSANVFNVLTASATNNDQNNSVNLNGSTFTFYGQSFGNLNVNENGLITFGGQPTINGNPAGPNTGALSDSPQQAAIAPFWTDLKLEPVTGRVLGRFVDTNGDGTNDYLILEFANARHVTAGGTTAQSATFQVFLQLNTGGVNGDVIFNYVNTAFGNASFDFGATNTVVGIKAVNPTANGSLPQKFTQIPFSSTDNFFGPGQAIRISSNTLGKAANPLSFSNTTDGFGYNAFSLPGDVKFDLAPQTATNGVFDFTTVPFDANNVQVGNVAQVLGANTFNLYGTTYSGASTIQITRNGYISFGGTTNDTPNNPNPINGTPILAPALVAPLWDNLVGPTGTDARVSARFVDFDGNGTPEFLILNWHNVHQGDINPDTPQNNETFQAVLELNTGGNPGGIFFDYDDTDVGNNAFNAGASATVGIKDVEPTAGNGRALTVLGPTGTHAEIDTSVNGVKGIGIFQVGSSQTVNILVLNVPPVINQGAAGDTINEGGKETRNVTITDPGTNDSFTGTIDWGDGSGVQNLNIAAVPNRLPTDPVTAVLSHFYGEVGTFTVTITLRDKDNGIATSSVTPPGSPITFTVIVKNIPPSHEPPNVPPIELRPGQILALPGPGAPALHFIDPAFAYDPTRPNTETYTFSINWGDKSPPTTGTLAQATALVNGFAPAGTYVLGSPPASAAGAPTLTQITLPDVNHTFATTGVQTVTVSVSDSNGGTGTYQFVVENGAAHIYAVSGDAGTLPVVQFFSTRLNVPIDSILAYDASFRGGVRVAVGDVTHDGLADVITAPGPGGGPAVEVFDGATSRLVKSFFAYSPRFAGGVYLASADFNRDGFADIVTGAGAGGGPHVELFSGKTGQVFQSFYAYGAAFSGGVRVAAGDVTGDGIPDIVTAPGPGMAPLIRVWSGATGQLVNQFFGFDPHFLGGAFVAIGDVNGDGRKDITVTLGGGGGPFARTFSGKTLGIISNITAFNPGSPTNGQPFTGGNNIWASGLRVATAPLFTDNLADVIVASGPGRRPEVRIFRSGTQTLLVDFTFFDPSSLAGTFVAAG
jgi:FG-GAP-like repeat